MALSEEDLKAVLGRPDSVWLGQIPPPPPRPIPAARTRLPREVEARPQVTQTTTVSSPPLAHPIAATASCAAEASLPKSENCLTRQNDGNTAVDEEGQQTQEIFRAVRSILNNLATLMYYSAAAQIQRLKIDTEERLSGTVDLVFEKALSEPSFSAVYANLCQILLTVKVPMKVAKTDDDGAPATVTFRKILLTNCQRVFEKESKTDSVDFGKLKELTQKLETDPENKELLLEKEELNAKMQTAKLRSDGNIRFIGELFKLKILGEPIMHECVVKLLRSADEGLLEALSILLGIIGKDLDNEKSHKRMDEYFGGIQKIIDSGRLQDHIKLMLQDLVKQRRNGW